MTSPSRIQHPFLAAQLILAFSLLCATSAHSAVIAQSAVNGASYLHSSLPNGKLAQGVLFVVFGAGMGPEALAQMGSFPLLTQLAGTAVSVSVAGTPVNCLMVYTSAKQIAAILPSTVSTGAASLTVRYNGESSDPLPIEVVPHAFGIFTSNQAGTGDGIIANPLTNKLNTLFSSADPGQLADIWGTGIGPVSANEAAGPAPGDLASLNVKVFVAGRQAQVVYRGRSGCCAGVDQIRFIVPEGASGCFVPVHVEVEGVPSNYATMSIAASGPLCSEAGMLAPADLQTAVNTGSLRSTKLVLTRVRSESPSSTTPRVDGANAYFYTFSQNEILGPTQGLLLPVRRLPLGSCMITQSGGIGFVELTHLGLDPGTISLSGPPGTFPLAGDSIAIFYRIAFIPNFPRGSSLGIITDGTLLTPGTYTFIATGGPSSLPFSIPKVGPFSVSIALPPLFDWTNRNSLQVIDRSQPLTLTWANQIPGALVRIAGSSTFALGNGPISLGFECWTEAASGSFTVPPQILATLPPSQELFTDPASSLGITLWTFGSQFTAPGLDSGRIAAYDSISKPVSFH